MSRPIRVLHVIKTFGLGGAETNLLNLVTAFDRSHAEHHVAYSSGGEIEGRFLEAGVRLFKYAEQSHRVASFATAGIVLRLAGYIRREKIDIVHTHNFNGHLWGALAAKLTGRKLVEHVHDFRYLDMAEFRRRRGESAQFGRAKLFKGWSDRVIVLTKQNRDYLVERKFYSGDKIRLIPNGIPIRPAASNAGPLSDWPASAKIVLTAARMADEKNIDLIPEIAGQVAARVPGVRFAVAGDGPLLNKLKASVSEKGLDGAVKFLGFQKDVHALLSRADVFLLPSFLELHSIAILEALSLGVPVLCSAGVGSNSDIFNDGQDAVLRDPFTRDGWADALIRLLTDEPFRRHIADHGRRLAQQRFTIENIARQIENVYEELVRT